MQFDDLNADLGESFIGDSIVFQYNDIRGFSSFNDSIDIQANLKNTKIYSKDLALFAPYLNRYDEHYEVSGQFSGTVNQFNMRGFELLFGNNSKLQGNISMDGLPEFEETFIRAKFSESRVNVYDIRQYISPAAFERASKFGGTVINANFLGFPTDFVADGSFATSIGNFDSDINLKINNENRDESTYSGKLSTTNFNLGVLIDQEKYVQFLDMNGEIIGKGLSVETADFNLNATIDKIGVNNYDYTNIETDGRFAKELFIGKMFIKDPNLKLGGIASIDLREKRNHILIRADLDTINLQPLGLYSKPAFARAYINADFTGLKLDKVKGTARLQKYFGGH